MWKLTLALMVTLVTYTKIQTATLSRLLNQNIDGNADYLENGGPARYCTRNFQSLE